MKKQKTTVTQDKARPESPPRQSLAIVGIGCVFPKAGNTGEYWSNIREGVDAIGDIPDSHWKPEDYFHQDQSTPDMTYAQRGGFIEPVDFEPLLYGMSPNNIEATDTTQLLGMVVAREALLDAGYSTGKDAGDGREFDRDRTSVILGVTGTLELVIPLGARLGHPLWRKALEEAGVDPETTEDVVQRISDSYVPWQENSFPGLLGNVAAGRIANRFDLGGTNCVVDAACASSLSAIHMAALELSSGRVDMAIAGGMDTFNDIFMYMCFSKTPALSPTGNSRPFAAGGDGTILGEGLGALVLKRLEDAQRDGDRIHAVIRGIGTSSDGRGNAIYAPSSDGQTKALKDAYQQANVTPSSIELVEAHGTGTSVGDAVEARALNGVYREDRPEGTWCAIGSVKSMIGHTKAAAGVAGLIKAALALEHKVLPPTIKVDQPLQQLEPGQAPVYINTVKRPWVANPAHPRRAAVSAFGFGGSNFHAVLEEADADIMTPDWDGRVLLLAFSADDSTQLQTQVKNLNTAASWDELRASAARSAIAFNPAQAERLILVIEKDKTDLAKQIALATQRLAEASSEDYWQLPGGVFYARGAEQGKTALLFPGQGSQYVGMLRDLACQFPSITALLSKANQAADGSEQDQRLSDLIYPIPVFDDRARQQQEEQLRDTRNAQPAIGVVSLAALQLLQNFGFSADYAAGHSYGELVALCAAGCMTEDELFGLSRVRGELMAAGEGDRGSMLAVSASIETVHVLLNEQDLELVVANHNAPTQVVLSGSSEAVDAMLALCKQQDLRASRLPVSAAFHSRFVADAEKPFSAAVNKISFATAQIPVLANTTADLYPADKKAAQKLLAGQLARPVEFVQEVKKLLELGVRQFVEVGPGNRLAGLTRAICDGQDTRVFSLDASSGKRSGQFDLACLLAPLAVLGQTIDLSLWDQNYLASLENIPARKPGMSIPLSGANYMKPREARPPRPMRTQAVSAPTAVVQKPETRNVNSVPATGSSTLRDAPNAITTGNPAPASQDVLQTTQQSILALQKMQQQTASLHKQYLEGQETAQQTIHQLLIQQQRLLQGLPLESTSPASVATQPGSGAPVVEPSQPSIPESSPVAAVKAAPVSVDRTTPAEISEVMKSSSSASINSSLLEVVSEKTGYPLEMLSLDMSLDTDLGIDSIKRVEILSALQERLPWAPTVDPEELSTFRFLHHIVEYLLAGAEAHQTGTEQNDRLTQDNSVDDTALRNALLEVVADKTGYPVEMLTPEMSLDADLGIDSIKRVEILSALQERLPDAPAVSPDELGKLQTLQQIIEHMATALPVSQTAVPAVGSPALSSALLEVVAEKTGYPVEMLTPEMSLDADLGIDSIKRVEILSALQERLPDAPAVSPDDLGRLQTLQQIIDYMNQAESETAIAPVALPVTGVTAQALKESLLEVVAEKTGYPVEMLTPEMSLDADLGIDSIKRVEILSALQERLPDAPAVSPDDLGRLQTLEQIIDHLGSGVAEQAAAQPQVKASGPSINSIAEAMLEVVAEKTGYPVEMLELPMNLEADLGIDSIKRVEILSSLQERMPDMPAVKPEELGELQTLQQIVDLMASSANTEVPVELATAEIGVQPEQTLDDVALLRSLVQLTELENGSRRALQLPANGVVWIVSESAEDAQAVCAAIKSKGLVAEIVAVDSTPDEPLAGLIIIAPQNIEHSFITQAFLLMQRAAPGLRETASRHDALLACVSRLGGKFGLDEQQVLNPLSAGLAGLVKTADKEWQGVSCKALDIDTQVLSAELAAMLVDECLSEGPLEVGFSDGKSYQLSLVESALGTGVKNTDKPLQPGDLVVVSGGARGVTAEVAVALAEQCAVNLLLLGRSAAPEAEADWLAGLQSEAEIKKALLQHSEAGTTPAQLQEKFKRLMANREVLASLARIRATGVQVNYESVDVRDAESLSQVFAQARKSLGPIRGLIHGAGVLADRSIEDKTQAQFEQVYATKVLGSEALLAATAEDELRVMVMFSSTTARLGRKGQCDYAAANEVLNKLAQQQNRFRPDCRVLSVNWGPWDGGMVTSALKKVFADEGVGVIPLQAGAEYLVQEISQPGPVEVVILGAPAVSETTALDYDVKMHVAFDRKLCVRDFPFLKSHVMNGQAVLPVALMVEWFAHGAMHGNPGMSYQGFDDLRVFKGVTLAQKETLELQILAGNARYEQGLAYVPVELRSGEVLHARSQVVLGNNMATPVSSSLKKVTGSYALAESAWYENGQLFHGQDLQGIKSILACADQGIVASVDTAPAPSSWIKKPVRSSWSADPLVLDASFQMMILWSFAQQGIASLPTAVGHYRQYCRTFPADGVEVVIEVKQSSKHRADASIEFIDNKGQLVARMDGYECVRDASLAAAFKRNTLENRKTDVGVEPV